MIHVKMPNGDIKVVPEAVYELNLKERGGVILDEGEDQAPPEDLIQKAIDLALTIDEPSERKVALEEILETNPTGYVRALKKELKIIDKLLNSENEEEDQEG